MNHSRFVFALCKTKPPEQRKRVLTWRLLLVLNQPTPVLALVSCLAGCLFLPPEKQTIYNLSLLHVECTDCTLLAGDFCFLQNVSYSVSINRSSKVLVRQVSYVAMGISRRILGVFNGLKKN